MEIFYGMSFTQGFSILIAPMQENKKKKKEKKKVRICQRVVCLFVVKTGSAQPCDSMQIYPSLKADANKLI